MNRRSKRVRAMYESWVSQHTTDLYRMAYRLMGDAVSAEDLVQETFYHAWRSIHNLRHKDRARSWLFQILRYRYAHTVRDAMRRPRTSALTEASHDEPAHSSPNVLESMANEEMMQKALDTLDDRFKIPLVMVCVGGLTCREVAEELDIPLGTVLSRIHRAKQTLRRRLDPAGAHTPEIQVKVSGSSATAYSQTRRLRLRG